MSNLFRIARKEFADLIRSPMVIVLLVFYIVFICLNIIQFSNSINLARSDSSTEIPFEANIGMAAANSLFVTLTWYSTIVGIIIGCSIISSERAGNALNTLLVKPVYRDTIINGKLLGSIAFLANVMILVIALNSAGFVMTCGSSIAPFLADYVSRIPFIFAFAMVYVMVFLSVSMLVSIVIRAQSFAMIISFITVLISDLMYNVNFALNLDNLFPGHGIGQLCVYLSPAGSLYGILMAFFNPSNGAFDAFIIIFPDLLKFFVYAAIATLLSYILFIKRDIS